MVLRMAAAGITGSALLAAPLAGRAAEALPAPVAELLTYRHIPQDAVSIYVEDVATGEAVLTLNEDVPRNPASVEKMVTTLVALDELGPGHRWRTEVHFLGDVHDETLDGDLLLKGFGDPYLVDERFWQLVREIRGKGIRNVTGNLLLDDSYFEIGDYDPGAFDREPLRAYNVAPNALMTNFKVVRYSFEPDPSSASVRVSVEPRLDNLDIVNRLQLVSGACRGYQRGITLTPNDDVSRVTFSGRFPGGCDHYAMDRTALSHNQYTFGLFMGMWHELGGSLSGNWKRVVFDEERDPDLVFESLPLSEVIAKVNKFSNNVMAKQLLLTLAAERYGPPGTEARGRQVVEEWLADHGMAYSDFRLENGAGLSRESRLTARHLATMLRYAYRSPYMPEYLASLSLPGVDGTLSRRFRDDSLTGQAHMKTGSMDHVSSVAGFFQARDGTRYIVVVLINHTDVHRGPGREVQETLLRWLFA